MSMNYCPTVNYFCDEISSQNYGWNSSRFLLNEWNSLFTCFFRKRHLFNKNINLTVAAFIFVLKVDNVCKMHTIKWRKLCWGLFLSSTSINCCMYISIVFQTVKGNYSETSPNFKGFTTFSFFAIVKICIWRATCKETCSRLHVFQDMCSNTLDGIS